MFNPLRYVTKLFDALYEATSDETVEDSPYAGTYANTRSRDGVYAITNTQSAESTYGVGKQTDSATVETDRVSEVETFECEDPRTCPTCEPA